MLYYINPIVLRIGVYETTLKRDWKFFDLVRPTSMHRLHSCLVWKSKKQSPVRVIEEPTKMQAMILKEFWICREDWWGLTKIIVIICWY